MTTNPNAAPGQQGGPREFDYGLCDCCDDIPQCLLVWTSPCVAFGRTHSIVEHGDDSAWVTWCCIYTAVQYFLGLGCILHIMTRSNVRKKYNIEGALWKDILFVWCFGPCALQQITRQTGQQGCNGAAPGAAAMH
eukprot:TRINITY_DN6622_c0_g1_i1.p1 TRINITY_DN6622_c0_g1~~TRINITY_DN6622_c0_g1_i1.p1  ORF type:complete len:135 (+),score=24.49 TRINITY_DN6622_c0_g1_i1:51-455(+)